MSDWMTLKEVADFLQFHIQSVYRMAQRGEIPAVKVGSQWRVNRSMLQEWCSRT